MLLALLIQSAIAPDGANAARGPQLSYANEAAAQAAPRPRINQGRSFQIDWNASDQSLSSDSRQERRPVAPARAATGRPGRTPSARSQGARPSLTTPTAT